MVMLPLGIGTSLLSGCAPLLAGGAVTGAVVSNDRRTAGTVMEDSRIESKASDFFGADAQLGSGQSHINTTSYNQMVLLTGEVATDELRKRAEEYVSRIAKIRHVYNELTVGPNSASSARANDSLITTKVKGKLISIREVSSSDVKVVTEAGVVYLMGLFEKSTGDAIAEAVASVGGIVKVVKLFEAQPPTATGG